MSITSRPLRMSTALTRRVAELHARGYDHDFSLTGNQQLFCVQTSNVYLPEATSVKLIDQAYDHLYKHYKYIHAVESDSGERGILLLSFIHFQALSVEQEKLTN
jgi:hypothetical protein